MKRGAVVEAVARSGRGACAGFGGKCGRAPGIGGGVSKRAACINEVVSEGNGCRSGGCGRMKETIADGAD